LAVHQLWFLENFDGDSANEDDTIEQMEWMTCLLARQSEEHRQTILTVVADLAAEEQNPELRNFLDSFGENTGLIPPSP